MPWYRMPDGNTYHIDFSGKLKRNPPGACRGRRDDQSICAVIAEFQCDWKIGTGKTCDRWICAAHAQQVAPDKHLCPEHQVAYKEWLARRAAVADIGAPRGNTP